MIAPVQFVVGLGMFLAALGAAVPIGIWLEQWYYRANAFASDDPWMQLKCIGICLAAALLVLSGLAWGVTAAFF